MSYSPLGRESGHSEMALPEFPRAGLLGTDLDDFLIPYALRRVGWLL